MKVVLCILKKTSSNYENKVISNIKFHRYCDKHYYDVLDYASKRNVHRLSLLDYRNIGNSSNSADRMEHLYDYRF